VLISIYTLDLPTVGRVCVGKEEPPGREPRNLGGGKLASWTDHSFLSFCGVKSDVGKLISLGCAGGTDVFFTWVLYLGAAVNYAPHEVHLRPHLHTLLSSEVASGWGSCCKARHLGRGPGGQDCEMKCSLLFL
jgi:hypothetical protein